jgi:hypothetical protein
MHDSGSVNILDGLEDGTDERAGVPNRSDPY